jgi:hypothetical protein
MELNIEKFCPYGPHLPLHSSSSTFFSGREKLLREELPVEEFSEVSFSHSVSFISQLKHRSAHKLGRFIVKLMT